jgi:hypothetical protein
MSEYLRKAAELIEQTVKEELKYAKTHPVEEKAARDANPHVYIDAAVKAATALGVLAAIDKGLLPEQIAEQVYDQFRTVS